MRLVRAACFVGVLLVLPGLAETARAQGTGRLEIGLVDATGVPVVDARVTLLQRDGRLVAREITTDAQGRARFFALPADHGYRVEVRIEGRLAATAELRIAPDATTNRRLQLGDLAEEPPARSAVPSPDEQVPGASRFDPGIVDRLPVEGSFLEAALPLTPGITDRGALGRPRVLGASAEELRIEVSGSTTLEAPTVGPLELIPSGAVQQLVVFPAGAGVEFGRATGGFARIVPRTGSNELAASVELRMRGVASSSVEGSRSTFEPAGAVSGPLVRDRAWYRVAWEGIDRDDPVGIGGGLTVSRTTDASLHAHRLTWQASLEDRFSLDALVNRTGVDRLGVDSLMPSESSRRFDGETRVLSGTWTHASSTRLLVEAFVRRSSRDTSLAPAEPGAGGDCLPAGNRFSDAYCLDVGSGRVSGAWFRREEETREGWELGVRGHIEDLRAWGVRHDLSWGASVDDMDARRRVEESDRIEFLRPFMATTGEDLDERVLRDFVLRGGDSGTIPMQDIALWAEERAVLRPSLVLTLGVRVDHQAIDIRGFTPFDPSAELEDYMVRAGSMAFFRADDVFTAYEGLDTYVTELEDASGLRVIPHQLAIVLYRPDGWQRRRRVDLEVRNTDFAPAFSLSWDPGGTGRDRVGASARRYYGSRTAEDAAWDSTPIRTLLGPAESDSPIFELLTPGRVDVTTVGTGLETPYQDEWRLLYERELAPEATGRIEYVNRRFRRQLRARDINRATGDFGLCRTAPRSFDAVVPSPGSGFELVDPDTGEVYVDTDPGIGDGRLDDCIGTAVLVPDGSGLLGQAADGLPDLYLQNPGWGQVVRVDNSGQRDEETFIAELLRRTHRLWGLQAAWAWTRSEGSGSAAEAFSVFDPRVTVRIPPDAWSARWHELDVSATGEPGFGFRVGGRIRWESGRPYTVVLLQEEIVALPPGVGFGLLSPLNLPHEITVARSGSGQADIEYNDPTWTVDLRLEKSVRVGRGWQLELSADVLDVFDAASLRIYNADLGAGQVRNGSAALRAEGGRRWQVGLRVSF